MSNSIVIIQWRWWWISLKRRLDERHEIEKLKARWWPCQSSQLSAAGEVFRLLLIPCSGVTDACQVQKLHYSCTVGWGRVSRLSRDEDAYTTCVELEKPIGSWNGPSDFILCRDCMMRFKLDASLVMVFLNERNSWQKKKKDSITTLRAGHCWVYEYK